MILSQHSGQKNQHEGINVSESFKYGLLISFLPADWLECMKYSIQDYVNVGKSSYYRTKEDPKNQDF